MRRRGIEFVHTPQISNHQIESKFNVVVDQKFSMIILYSSIKYESQLSLTVSFICYTKICSSITMNSCKNIAFFYFSGD